MKGKENKQKKITISHFTPSPTTDYFTGKLKRQDIVLYKWIKNDDSVLISADSMASMLDTTVIFFRDNREQEKVPVHVVRARMMGPQPKEKELKITGGPKTPASSLATQQQQQQEQQQNSELSIEAAKKTL